MATVLETRHIKVTRKDWRCDGCFRRFPAGGPKTSQRIVGDDGPFTWKECATCSAIVDEIQSCPSTGHDFFEGITSEHIQEFMRDKFNPTNDRSLTWKELCERADAHYSQEQPK